MIKLKDMDWEDQLNKVVLDNSRDNLFGTNIHWTLKDVRKYIKKLIFYGAADLEIIDYNTIAFTLPPYGSGHDRVDILLFIMTYYLFPAYIKHNKRTDRLTLSWDY